MNNYQPTSNASGIIQAPKEARYFIQRMSRQGKSEGRWIFATPLKLEYGFKSLKVAKLIAKNEEKKGAVCRVQLTEVFI